MIQERCVENARHLFSSSYNCAQAVLMSLLRESCIEFDSASYIMAGFGGGIGGYGSLCGAVVGAIAALGQILRESIDDRFDHKLETGGFAHEFAERFASEFETLICKDLLDSKKNVKAAESNSICMEVVEASVRIVCELLSPRSIPYCTQSEHE
ncbi:MAG: C-GCAxxG-C-C family (seleno)protein [Candidatus Thorarchaeota archaeon]